MVRADRWRLIERTVKKRKRGRRRERLGILGCSQSDIDKESEERGSSVE